MIPATFVAAARQLPSSLRPPSAPIHGGGERALYLPADCQGPDDIRGFVR